MNDIVPYMERVRARFDEPEMQKAFCGFHKTLLFTFPDLQRDFLLTINEDGSATLAEASRTETRTDARSHSYRPSVDVKVTATSDLLMGILDRRINPVNAYITRKLRVVGNMEDLLRLQKIL